jgi:uncharacterized protein
MTVETNKELALRFLDDMSARGAATFADYSLITEDFEWWAQSLGVYDAPAMVKRMGEVGKIFAGQGRRTIKGVTAEGDRVVVEYTGDTPLTNGKRYQNTYLSLFVIRDGRVATVREYCDTGYARDTLRT